MSVGAINSIAFVFHVDDIRSSEYSCVGMSNCHVIRHKFRNNTCRVLETMQRNDHKAFSTLLPNFYSCFNHDYCEDTWLGITIIKRHLSKMLCKNKADAGVMCTTEKSSIISFSKVAWHHIKNKSEGVAVHIRSTKTRTPQLEHNFGLRSAVECRAWQHIQYKTKDDLDALMKIIGKYALHGRRQHLPTKIEGYYCPLNLNDIINYVLADSDVDTTFSWKNLRNCGVDFIFCEKVGLKIWVRFRSEVAKNNQTIANNFLQVMNQNAEAPKLKPADVDDNDIALKPNMRFQYDKAMFRIDNVGSDTAHCTATQSKNEIHNKGSACQFDDLFVIKNAIVKRLKL